MTSRTLKDRKVTDKNFGHTLGLLGPCASWAETLGLGHKIERNDLNMIAIPVEIALAFARERLAEDSPVGEGARKAFELLAAFRAAFAPEPEPAAADREPDLFDPSAEVQPMPEAADGL